MLCALPPLHCFERQFQKKTKHGHYVLYSDFKLVPYSFFSKGDSGV